jgi:hypothetical protein
MHHGLGLIGIKVHVTPCLDHLLETCRVSARSTSDKRKVPVLAKEMSLFARFKVPALGRSPAPHKRMRPAAAEIIADDAAKLVRTPIEGQVGKWRAGPADLRTGTSYLEVGRRDLLAGQAIRVSERTAYLEVAMTDPFLLRLRHHIGLGAGA